MISWLWRMDGTVVLPAHLNGEQAARRIAGTLERQWKTVRVLKTGELKFSTAIPFFSPNWLELAPFDSGFMKISATTGVLTYSLSSLQTLLYLLALPLPLAILSSGAGNRASIILSLMGVICAIYVTSLAIARPRAAQFLRRSLGV